MRKKTPGRLLAKIQFDYHDHKPTKTPQNEGTIANTWPYLSVLTHFERNNQTFQANPALTGTDARTSGAPLRFDGKCQKRSLLYSVGGNSTTIAVQILERVPTAHAQKIEPQFYGVKMLVAQVVITDIALASIR